jgi:hypothetical protein
MRGLRRDGRQAGDAGAGEKEGGGSIAHGWPLDDLEYGPACAAPRTAETKVSSAV